LNKSADHVFDEPMREHGAALRALIERTPAPTRPGGRAARASWMAAGVTAVTGAVAAGFMLFSGAGAAAYAVTQNPNGTLTIAVRQASAIDAVNARLRALGARVAVVPLSPACPSSDSLVAKYPRTGQVEVEVQAGDNPSVTIDAKSIPTDGTLVISLDSARGGMVPLVGPVVTGPTPHCIGPRVSDPHAPVVESAFPGH
jgi:hypothetical protein